jgi:hypothetical protein
MEELLHEFSPLFQEPIAVRSYCYAHVEKEELEKQCSAMLQSTVI